MPLYDFSCVEGHRFERMVPLRDFDAPQACPCGSAARRVLSAPRLMRDTIAPCLGADGQMHDSMASYRRSLEPGGNPQGERYLEMGDEAITHAPPTFDRAERRDHIKAAIEDVRNNRVPPLTVLED